MAKISSIMEKITAYVKSNPILTLVLILLLFLSYKGVKSYWSEFKINITQSVLEEQGLELDTQNKVVLKDLETSSAEVEKVLEKVDKVDFQVYKKNEKSKAETKGIKITANDIRIINSADSLVSKWKRK